MRQVADGGGQGLVDRGQRLHEAVEAAMHPFPPGRDLGAAHPLRRRTPARWRGQGHVKLSGQRTQPTRFFGVGVRQRPREGLAARSLGL